MGNRVRFFLLAALMFGLVIDTVAQKQYIFQAMKDEMDRTMSSLRIDTLKPPYYLAYTINESESYSVRASMGSLISTGEYPRSRQINVQLRVGNQSFDNSNFLSLAAYTNRSRIAFVTDDGTLYSVFEDDYDALRRDLWLTTDIVYKRALDDLSKKKAVLQNKVRTDSTADFSPVKPYAMTTAPATERFDKTQWEERARRMSAVLKKYPGIQTSAVNVGLAINYMYFLNNEGSRHARPSVRSYVEVTATTQASDGMPLNDFVAFYANSPRELPGEKEMIQQIEAMASELTALREASLLDSYSGPVVFEKQAAAELVSQGLGPLLCNIREPVADNPQIEQMMKSQFGEPGFQNKIGVKVLADFLSVTDDPTKTSFNGTALTAGFPVDAEGVPAREVKLIEKGILKTLLTCRTPHKRIPESNGHARGSGPQPFISNLFVTATRTLSDADLKTKLIEMCKERGLEFGIIIRKMSNPYFKRQARDPMDVYSMLGLGGSKPLVTEPLCVYKVLLDGHEERVRGMEITGMTPQSFKEITEVSTDVFVYNQIAGLRKPTYSSLFNPPDARVSVVTPSLLFESIDLKKSSAPHRTPPIAPRPVFSP